VRQPREQPQRGSDSYVLGRQEPRAATPLGLMILDERYPKVVPMGRGQLWALSRNPFGILGMAPLPFTKNEMRPSSVLRWVPDNKVTTLWRHLGCHWFPCWQGRFEKELGIHSARKFSRLGQRNKFRLPVWQTGAPDAAIVAFLIRPCLGGLLYPYRYLFVVVSQRDKRQ